MTAISEAPTIERVLKVSEVAEHLGCTPTTIYPLIAEGTLRAIRVGRLLRVPESALAEFIAGAAR
ncbi:helix-turn-helix domain-containing protein [Brevibacterium permense]|uniref:helix-turn-helix domain-containing protein n=1 Tax=Brevibacterium permense TaxID=234834 RepID=UPI0021D2FC32